MRGVGAALVAASIVLAGCGVVEVDEAATTTTTVDPDSPVNPWSLPLEERPPLFDPCDIPIEVVEKGVGMPLEYDDGLRRHGEDGVGYCAWRAKGLIVGSLSTWKAKSDYLTDKAFSVVGEVGSAGDRTALRLIEHRTDQRISCFDLYFTQRGTVWINVNITDPLNRFRGEYVASACDVLDRINGPIISHLPEGDF